MPAVMSDVSEGESADGEKIGIHTLAFSAASSTVSLINAQILGYKNLTSKLQPAQMSKKLIFEDFVPVKSRGKRNVKFGSSKLLGKANGLSGSSTDNPYLMKPQEKSVNSLTNESILKKLKMAQSHLETSGFSAYFKELLIRSLQTLDPLQSPNYRTPSKIVCFGLGTFSECIIARYQLALLIILQQTLDINEVELFDPMFCDQESSVLQDLRFHVLNINEEGKRPVEDLTIFYLPHCSHQLVNNLLFANWEFDKLQNCVIISNSFSNIYTSVPPRLLLKSLSFISRVAEICEEIEVENSFEYSDIFNDTAIHTFPKCKSYDKIHEFWLDRVVPTYQDSDFVKASCKPR